MPKARFYPGLITNFDDSSNYFKNQDAHDAILFHEIQHIVHDDDFVRKHRCNTLLASGHKHDRVDLFIEKFDKFQEKRADILGSLACLQYPHALGFALLFLEYPISNINNNYMSYDPHLEDLSRDSFTHPSFAERDAYLKKLSQEMYQTPIKDQLIKTYFCCAEFLLESDLRRVRE